VRNHALVLPLYPRQCPLYRHSSSWIGQCLCPKWYIYNLRCILSSSLYDLYLHPKYSETAMFQSLELTFGLELEFIVRYDPSKYEAALGFRKWDPRTRRETKFEIILRDHIIKELKGIGIPICERREKPTIQKWVITSDESIDCDNEPNCVGIEIKSSAYNLSEAALTQVEAAIKSLNDKFDIFVNESCGLHVHVGNQRKGFQLQTLKNFCMLTTIFERQLNSLHPPDRVSGLGMSFAKGPTQAFKGINLWDTALLLQSAPNHRKLIQRYATKGKDRDRNQAYNLMPLVDEPLYNTIEFRQHEATTEPSAIRKWIELTCGLVTKAHSIPLDHLTQLILDFAFDPRPPGVSIIDLLHSLQLHGAADYYSHRVLYKHPRPGHAWVDSTLEDGIDLHTNKLDVSSIGGKKIVKTLSRRVAPSMGLVDIRTSRRSHTSSPMSDELTTKVESSEELPHGEQDCQAVPSPPLTADQQRIRNIIRQSPRSTFRNIREAELAAGCDVQRVGSSISVASDWSVD